MASPMRAVQFWAWTVAAVMLAAVVWGLVTADEGAAGALLANRWGQVTVVDLYLALGLGLAWIAWRERSTTRTVLWGLALVVTGSIALATYVAIAAGRSRTMTELLVGPNDISLE